MSLIVRLYNGVLVRVLRSRGTLAILRLLHRLDRRRVEPDSVTVVIVNWNSLEYLRSTLDAIRRFSDPTPGVLVVDNASRDGSKGFLRRSDVAALRLPVNVGHGAAMDLGCLLTRSEYLVALDVDAFPVSDSWLEVALEPLRRGRRVVGAHFHRHYAHPCFLAMRQDRFVSARHTFRSNLPPREQRAREKPNIGTVWWDAGESISIREGPDAVELLPASSVRGPGVLGSVFAGVVYHNFYSTLPGRHPAPGEPDADEVWAAWNEAVDRYLAPYAR